MAKWEEEISDKVTFWMGEAGTGFDGFVRWNHNCMNSDGKPFRSNSAIPIDLDNPKHWNLISSDPITLTPSILCTPPHGCGIHGFITDGKWVTA